MSNAGYELNWDDQIENDGQDFVILPDGDYDFEVVTFERARHAGSDKLPPCNKAVVHIRIVSPDGDEVIIKHNLFLHSSVEGLLCAFFTAIGQRRHGERLTMNWSAVTGSRGRCKVYVDNWTGKDGEPKQSNKIKKFYEPDDSVPPAAPSIPAEPAKKGYQQGRF
jgi:hypothetical protein